MTSNVKLVKIKNWKFHQIFFKMVPVHEGLILHRRVICDRNFTDQWWV